jgi:hypothetical protein
MSDNLTDYAESLLLTWLCTSNSVTRPTAWYVGLFVTPTTDEGYGVEIDASDYSRQSVTFDFSGSNLSNTNQIDFGSTSDWPAITNIAIFDAPTGGKMLCHGPVATAIDPTTGDFVQIDIGALILTLN